MADIIVSTTIDDFMQAADAAAAKAAIGASGAAAIRHRVDRGRLREGVKAKALQLLARAVAAHERLVGVDDLHRRRRSLDEEHVGSLGRVDGEDGEGGAIGDFQIFNRVLNAEEAQVVKQWPAADKLRYLVLHDKEYRNLSEKQAAMRAEALEIRLPSPSPVCPESPVLV